MSARTGIESFRRLAGFALALAFVGPVAEALQSEGSTMKAIVYREFGSPDVLRLEEVEKPVPLDDQVLVRVRAAALNPLDWHFLEGTPYIARPLAFGLFAPKDTRLGVDYAGTIEAVGKSVTRFQPGDEVFGGGSGTLAEYVCVRAEGAVVEKPAGITLDQAAAVPVAALTALQSLRDRAQVRPGAKVLINGASGGVGTFAVQIAKSFGAHVTGVCSTRNVELVLSLGADRVIDYTKEVFTQGDQRYDVILDNVGNHSLLDCRRALEPGGHYVLIGGGGVFEARWLGPLPKVVRLLVLSPFVSQDMRMFLANMNRDDLAVLADMMQAGKVTPVIDRRYGLNEVAEAFRYLEQGHARGKVIVTLDGNGGLPSTGAESARAPESRTGSVPIALGLFGGLLGATLVPIAAALVLDRRHRRRHPGKRPFRWGYYFSLQSVVMALIVGALLGSGTGVVVALALVYAALAWAFARRRHWAWILLTILSFNPIAWLVNAVYLRKRWTESSGAATP